MSLRRVGSRYVGLCPFHNEKTPSFDVNREQGFFHCFGCGVGGNVFKFVELHERLSFPEAVRVLAQQVRRRRCPRRPTPAAMRQPTRERESADHAARGRGDVLSRACWRPTAGRRGRDLLDRARPGRRRSIESLGYGFAPPGATRCSRTCAARASTPELAVKAGLVADRDGGCRRSLLEPPDDPDLPRERPGRRLRRPGDGRRPGRRST